MGEDINEKLAWESRSDDFIIERLPGSRMSPLWSVYIAQDDPHAGIGIDRVEVLDDLILRLQQAREWLMSQNGSREPST